MLGSVPLQRVWEALSASSQGPLDPQLLYMRLPFSGSHWSWLNCSHWKAQEQTKAGFQNTQEPPYVATLNVTPRWQWCTTQLLLLQFAELFFHWVSLGLLFTDLQHQSSWMEEFICYWVTKNMWSRKLITKRMGVSLPLVSVGVHLLGFSETVSVRKDPSKCRI